MLKAHNMDTYVSNAYRAHLRYRTNQQEIEKSTALSHACALQSRSRMAPSTPACVLLPLDAQPCHHLQQALPRQPEFARRACPAATRPRQRQLDETPLELLDTDVGARLVESMLIQIDEGYFA